MRKYFLMLLAAACLLTSCEKHEKHEDPQIIGENPPEFDTSDSNIHQCINNTVYISSSISGSLLDKSLSARCSQRTSTLSDADVIIFSDDIALGNDTKSIAEIARALHSGKIVGYANPSGQAFKQFAENIRTASENLLKDNDFHTIVDCYFFQHLDDAMGSNLPNDTPNAFARLVAICSEGIFVMGSPEDATVHATYTEIDPDTSTETTHDIECSDDIYTDTPRGIGEMMEIFAKWVNGKMDDNTDASNGLEPIRRDLTYVNTIYFNAENITDCALTRSLPFEIYYEFWPVCDHADNTIKDVYAVRRTIKVDGDNLDTGPKDKNSWWFNSKKDPKYYGPYLRRVMDKTSCSAATAMRELKPLNAMSSTSYSESTNMGINAGIGIGANPSLNLTFSYSKNYSTSTSVPDIATSVKAADSHRLPEYTFLSVKRPDSHLEKVIYVTHDIVPNNYNEYIELQTSWIWDMSYPEDEAHACTDNVEIDIEMMDVSYGFFKTHAGYYDKTFKFNNVGYNLPALPHYNQIWGVEVNQEGMSREEKMKFIEWLEKRYKDYFSINLFNVPAYSTSDRTGVEKFRNDFIDVLKRDTQFWKDFDYTGTFHFTWRNNQKPDETYTYDFIISK